MNEVQLLADVGSPPATLVTPPERLLAPLRRYYCVIYALMMHDIKNRFFGSGLGQIAMVIWPFVHILVMLIIYTFAHRPTPYGDSLLMYSAVSIYPFICFTYVSRWIVFSGQSNRSFLQYPIIRPLDILVARALLEMVSITLVAILLLLTLMAFGNDPIPVAPAEAVFAFCGTVFLSIGMGFLNGVIAMAMPLWAMIYSLVIILAYVSSGVLFVPSTLPEQIRVPLSYNPLLVCTEWFRAAYYSEYPTMLLDRPYVFEFGLVTITAGLLLERLLRRLF